MGLYYDSQTCLKVVFVGVVELESRVESEKMDMKGSVIFGRGRDVIVGSKSRGREIIAFGSRRSISHGRSVVIVAGPARQRRISIAEVFLLFLVRVKVDQLTPGSCSCVLAQGI